MDRPLAGWLMLAAALAPSLAAVTLHPGFVTQDGPAHHYNAYILTRPPAATLLASTFEVRRDPLPNWAGHLARLGLMHVLPGRAVDRAMAALTLIGLSAATYRLRLRVAGPRGAWVAGLWSGLAGLNLAWLLGFESFLLGAALLVTTLGTWWSGRAGMSWPRALGLSLLLVLGYVCHLVSLGLTAVGLAVLELLTPGPDRRRRALRTAAALLVLVPLGLVYRSLMSRGGPSKPVWRVLSRPWTLGVWGEQLAWVDPISLASKRLSPVGLAPGGWNGLLAPALWFAAAGAVLVLGSSWPRVNKVWHTLAGLLILGGVVGPDSLGPGHGDYLPQRAFLVGLVALLPALDLGGRRRSTLLGGGLLVGAVALQSVHVWGYARRSDQLVGEFLAVSADLGDAQRIGTLFQSDLRGDYRSNPLRHLDCLLGVGADRVLWTNYEAAHYYFPVGYRPGLARPPGLEFEAISILDDPADAEQRARRWRKLLADHHPEIDRLVTWGDDLGLEAITARWYVPGPRRGRARAWSRRPG